MLLTQFQLRIVPLRWLRLGVLYPCQGRRGKAEEPSNPIEASFNGALLRRRDFSFYPRFLGSSLLFLDPISTSCPHFHLASLELQYTVINLIIATHLLATKRLATLWEGTIVWESLFQIQLEGRRSSVSATFHSDAQILDLIWARCIVFPLGVSTCHTWLLSFCIVLPAFWFNPALGKQRTFFSGAYKHWEGTCRSWLG